jgi:hypothetical protein
VNVVDLDRRRGGLMGLVETLQLRGQQPLGRAQKACRAPDVVAVDTTDRRRALGTELRNPLAQLSKPTVCAAV